MEKVQGDHAGLHVLVHVKTGYNEQELCRFAAERGVKLSGLSEHLIPAREEEKRRQEAVLLLGYENRTRRKSGRDLVCLTPFWRSIQCEDRPSVKNRLTYKGVRKYNDS